tara:strand:- start:281 stop:967 length:687 start_codon:yes stop_codon:yes gene_type:complete
MSKLLKIAHRGYSLLRKKENTLFAFQNAIKKNFDMIELDLHLSKSNDLIIHHDDYIISNKRYYFIKDLSYNEINAVNPFIITLPFFFKNIDKEKIKVYLDIKGNEKIMKPLLNYLDLQFNDFNNLILASFNRKCIKETNKFNKNKSINHPKYLETGFITDNIYTEEELKFLLEDIEYIIVYWSMLDDNLINFCKKNNKKVYCYTLTDKEQLKFINKFEIDGIVSDILF